MLYLADLLLKEVFCGETHYGSNPIVAYDNLTRKCALKIDGRLFAVDKLQLKQGVRVNNALPISSECKIGNNAVNCFGEIFVGQRVYDVNGKFLGEVENAELTERLVLKKIWTQEEEFLRGQILSVGDAIVIRAKTPKQLLRQSQRKRDEKKPKATPKNIPQATLNAPKSTTPLPTQNVTASHQPTRGHIRKRYGNFNFLLGKIVDKTIVNFQGEVMIKKAERVTREVLRQAKISGKLIELYLHVE